VPPPTRRCPAQWLLRGRRNVASLCYGLITSLVPAPSIGSVVTVCGKCAALGCTTTMSLQQQSKSQRIVGIAMQRKSRQVELESQPTLRPPTLSKTNTAAGESLDSSAEDSSRQQNEVRAKYKPNVGAYTRRIIAGGDWAVQVTCAQHFPSGSGSSIREGLLRKMTKNRQTLIEL